MSNDFSRNAHVSSRELGSRTRILHALHIDPWLMLPLIALKCERLVCALQRKWSIRHNVDDANS